MQPYLVQQIVDNQGAIVSTHQPTPWMTAATPQAAASVSALMKLVVTQGTAAQVGFSPLLDAAVKTGTAQTGNPKANTDDWMIGLAPASNPKIAVAVVVPYQNFSNTGAGVRGSDHEGHAQRRGRTAWWQLTDTREAGTAQWRDAPSSTERRSVTGPD